MSWNRSDISDQSGKIVIVTGANSGIGFETARALLQKGANVILACRNEEKGNQALQMLLQETPNASAELMLLNLANLSSIESFAKTFQEKYQKLDLLLNNAGIMMPPLGKTQDGFELQFGTNHLGHFALTGRLFSLLEQTENARIVNVSSLMHKIGQIKFDNLNAEKKYSPTAAYSQSKLANLLFTYELQRRLAREEKSMIAVAAHPGGTKTNLQSHSKISEFFIGFYSQNAENGALPTLYAATEPGVISGQYFGPSGFMEVKGSPKLVFSNQRSHNEGVAAKLWSVSEELTGVRFLS